MKKSVKKLKYNYHRISKDSIEYPIFTQPSMAFTPRQIIEQFATGEVIAQENHETDDFYDDKFTEDQLFALNIINDDFQLRQYVLDFYDQQDNKNVVQDEKKDVNPGATSDRGVKTTPVKDVTSVQSSESGE